MKYRSLLVLLRKGTLLSASFFLVLFISCKKEGELIPEFSDSDLDIAEKVIEVSSVSVLGDSILTTGNTRFLLGKLYDQTYGFSSSEFYTQLDLSTVSMPIPDVVTKIDSVVLLLGYDKYYGFPYSQEVYVYELSESFVDGGIYYSNQKLDASGELLGKALLEIREGDNFTDSTHILRIKMDNSLGDRIIAAGGFDDGEAWTTFFKGLRITADPNPDPSDPKGEGAIVSFNLNDFNSTRLAVFYVGESGKTEQYALIMAEKNKRFSHFEHDRSGSLLMASLNDQTSPVNYVMGMGGARTKLVFKGLKGLSAAEIQGINKAELIIPYVSPEIIEYDPADRMALIYRDDNGTWVLPVDYNSSKGGSSYVGGNVDLVNLEYRFNLASTVHEMLKNGNEDLELFLTVSGSGISASRITLISGSNSASERKIYLILTYTKPG